MDFLQTALSVPVIFFVIIALSTLWRHVVFKYKLRKLDRPRGLPILGNLLQLGTDSTALFAAFTKWAEEFRDKGIFVLYFGLKPAVVITNAADTEIILSNVKLHRKAFFYDLARPFVGDGLIISVGSKWSLRRKLLTPSFHFSILLNFLDVMNEQASILTQILCRMTDRSNVNISPLLALCSLDIVCETMMGLQLGAQKGKSREYINALNRLGEIFSARFRSPLYWNEALFGLFPLGREQAKCIKILHQTTQKVIRERKAERKNKQNVIIDDKSQEVRKRRRLAFLDLIIEVQEQHKDLTDENIQEEVDTFMFAGHDTISSATSFALYLIGRHPKVQRKLQQELDLVFGKDSERPVTTEDIQRLEYLNCVVKECLRLFPPAPLLGRETEEDVNIGGCSIPKGTTICLGLFWLHRDPNQFPNPNTFDPDRFLPDKIKERHHFGYTPFSGGHRNCIGQKFAQMEQRVILATVLRKLEVTSLQTVEELGLINELVLRAANGVKIKLDLR